MSRRYAQGKRAWGECAKSGRRMLLNSMVVDGFSGLLVDPAWYEPPLPKPPRELADGIALLRPAPDRDIIDTVFEFGTGWDLSTDKTAPPFLVYVGCTPPTITVT